MMIQTDKLWSQIVHYYIDKKGYSKEDANNIAQRIITREINRKICQNMSCNHLVPTRNFLHVHVETKQCSFLSICSSTKWLHDAF